ncbi:type II toxin-antitoxin system MqsA family antitoxin [uncultured Thiothrix sp.]|uniref:type II toxin-antitoxin system MqsA family antitoxin n=1 Tax=uncultured Thiothrix sp. TaxID=223185 RepID=UPI002621ED4E|nr:type II toxin-antitoxin system MqsA family antitoxin [uncultured Thiothrix sp.]HRJ94758.1 type II toxin-antitoxin system MqsA family antitoxin [Candidatus Thiothrix moscowensis]
MQCTICKMGETSAGKVTVTLQRGELTVLIKNVPAQICESCGEYYLSDEITDQVLKQAEASAARNAEVEILRFAA